MIGWLRGRVVDRHPDGELVVDVGGVGYRVSVPAPLLASAGGPGTEIELHVHTHVRDDAIVLYGFGSTADRATFEALLGAHGVGPALALSVLATLGPVALSRAVLDDDVDALCAVPGVGRKTAARLVIDLKAKLAVPDAMPVTVPGSSGAGAAARGEVRAALAELGYGADEIRRALDALPGDGGVEELLRLALRELAASR